MARLARLECPGVFCAVVSSLVYKRRELHRRGELELETPVQPAHREIAPPAVGAGRAGDRGRQGVFVEHPAAMSKTAIVLGASGLIGSELVKILKASSRYGSILLLNRRPSGEVHPKVSERVIDFEAPDLSGIAGDDFYCAFGTTMRKAGSRAVFQRIDCEYPTRIATQLHKQGFQRMLLVSSVGAKSDAGSFYLRTKAQLEENVIGLGFAQTVIARPSLLLGPRGEFRLGERVAVVLMKLLAPLMLGTLRRYRPVAASAVAHALVQAADSDDKGVRLIASDQM